MATSDTTMSSVVWLGKRPKAVPEFVPYVMRKNPSLGHDSPRSSQAVMILFDT